MTLMGGEEMVERKKKKQHHTTKKKRQSKKIDGEDPIQASEVFSKLPVEVAVDILSRLPLKTISKCRWVCKTWYDLICNPLLAQIYHVRAIKNKSPCMVLCELSTKNYYFIDSDFFDMLGISTEIEMRRLKLREFKNEFRVSPTYFYRVVGAVNGLICFSSNLNSFYQLPYYICNPITGEHVLLPEPINNDIALVATGFGYDSIKYEYKVIRIWKKYSKFEAEVYAQSLGRWRKIKNAPNISKGEPMNVFVNGFLHWMPLENDFNGIASFDVGKEEFNLIQLPPYINAKRKSMGLGVLGERLSFIDDTTYSNDKVIWVMKDYGVQESWVKEYVLEIAKMGAFPNACYEVIQLRNGILLLHDWEGHIGYYDPQKGSYSHIVIINLKTSPRLTRFSAIMQVGSLFSPKC